MKLKKLLHIGKIICEVVGIGLGIAALCSPAAGIAIAAAIVGAATWSLSYAEDTVKDDYQQLSCGYPSLKTSEKSETKLVSGDDSANSLLIQIDDYIDTNVIVNLESISLLGNHDLIVDEI